MDVVKKHLTSISSKEEEGEEKSLVVACTHASSERFIKCVRELDFHFDFLVVDEAHNYAGQGQGRKAKWMRESNFEENFDRVMFLTATPKYFEGKKNCTSMDDEKIFGKIFF